MAFATGAALAERIGSEGFVALAAGIDQHELESRFTAARERIAMLPIPERRPQAFTNRFALIDSPARLDDLRDHAAAWRPDVIVHESAELAGPVVAAGLNIPSVNHSFGRMIPRAAIDRAAPAAAAMWERAGLDPEPFAGFFRGMYVDISPASLASEHPPAGTPVLRMRPVETASNAVATQRPLVYVTLGTIASDIAVFQLLLAALAHLDIDVLVTTGKQNDPATLEPLPANATVERYVPQAEVLPRASIVVTHGGSGSMLGALAHGLPMVIAPRAADQFENASAAADAGVALVLLPDELTEDAVCEAVGSLIADGSYRAAARTLADEIAAMPSPREVAATIAGAVNGL